MNLELGEKTNYILVVVLLANQEFKELAKKLDYVNPVQKDTSNISGSSKS